MKYFTTKYAQDLKSGDIYVEKSTNKFFRILSTQSTQSTVRIRALQLKTKRNIIKHFKFPRFKEVDTWKVKIDTLKSLPPLEVKDSKEDLRLSLIYAPVGGLIIPQDKILVLFRDVFNAGMKCNEEFNPNQDLRFCDAMEKVFKSFPEGRQPKLKVKVSYEIQK